MSKAIITAFLATSAVALAVNPTGSARDHASACAATEATAATARPAEIVAGSATHRGVRGDGVAA